MTSTIGSRSRQCSHEVGGSSLDQSPQKNRAAFVHDLPGEANSNAAGDSNYLRVQVLTPVAVLDRDRQPGVVPQLTDIVAAAANDSAPVDRTWVLVTESPEGGGGNGGGTNTDADLVAAAGEELS